MCPLYRPMPSHTRPSAPRLGAHAALRNVTSLQAHVQSYTAISTSPGSTCCTAECHISTGPCPVIHGHQHLTWEHMQHWGMSHLYRPMSSHTQPSAPHLGAHAALGYVTFQVVFYRLLCNMITHT